jgi:hypothetical protein
MIYLPPEIWIKIISMANHMMVIEKKLKFGLIHKDIYFETNMMSFLEYNYDYNFTKFPKTPVALEYKKFDTGVERKD